MNIFSEYIKLIKQVKLKNYTVQKLANFKTLPFSENFNIMLYMKLILNYYTISIFTKEVYYITYLN